jgi:hypothetical protein
MNDQQLEEIIRQLKRLNSNLNTMGVLLLGLLLGMAILLFMLWKGLNLRF